MRGGLDFCRNIWAGLYLLSHNFSFIGSPRNKHFTSEHMEGSHERFFRVLQNELSPNQPNVSAKQIAIARRLRVACPAV